MKETKHVPGEHYLCSSGFGVYRFLSRTNVPYRFNIEWVARGPKSMIKAGTTQSIDYLAIKYDTLLSTRLEKIIYGVYDK